MFHSIRTQAGAALRIILAVTVSLGPSLAYAENPLGNLSFKVSAASDRMEIVVNSSKIVETDFKVPRMLVQNPELLQATPIAPNKVQVSALKAGVTQLNMWDEQGQVHTVDVVVTGDARELEVLLKDQFPDASLRVRPLASSVIISGYVPSADQVSRIVSMAEDFYPKVIQNITVGGAQTVLLHVKVMEVSRTKLRQLGIDWALLNSNVDFVQKVSGTITSSQIGGGAATVTGAGETLALGVVKGADSFFTFIDALRQNNLVKILAEPTLVTVSGRPASFNSGGEFPILVPQSLGTTSIEYRQFGTRVDFVPIVLGNGSLRLEVRPQISEIDQTRSVTLNNVTVPGLRSRWVDTAVELQAGQTLALAGLIQNRVETENKGVPFLADLPWVGTAFRRVEELNNEIELLIMVTPEFVDAMDPDEVPQCGPGQRTTRPNDVELYHRGYMEVPKCCDEPNGGGNGVMVPQQQGQQSVYGPSAPHASQSPFQVEGGTPAGQASTFAPYEAPPSELHGGYQPATPQTPPTSPSVPVTAPPANPGPLLPGLDTNAPGLPPEQRQPTREELDNVHSATRFDPTIRQAGAEGPRVQARSQYQPNFRYRPSATMRKGTQNRSNLLPKFTGPSGYDVLK